jgi:hypothetical protein
MKRFSAIALVLFVAVQATAVASTRMVCRYTGKVMESCSCPERAASAELEQPGCCTVVSSEAAPVAAREREQVQVRSVELLVPFALSVPSFVSRFVDAPRQVETPPPDGERYLRLRQLLI